MTAIYAMITSYFVVAKRRLSSTREDGMNEISAAVLIVLSIAALAALATAFWPFFKEILAGFKAPAMGPK